MKSIIEPLNKFAPCFIIGICIILISAFYIPAAQSKVNGHIAPINVDTLSYYTHAKNWAEGHPYVYNPGDPPSTGGTSHLYPIILSLLYRLGCTSHKLITATFILNSLFLLAYLSVVWKIIKRTIEPPLFQIFAFALIATNGHLLYHFLGQSDMGLFTLCSGIMFLTVLLKKHHLLSFITLILPLVRPEGIVLNIAYAIAAVYTTYTRREKGALLPAITGVAGILTLFSINFALTGNIAFDSTILKGHLIDSGLRFGLVKSLSESMQIFQRLFMGNISGTPCFILMPVAGSLLAILAFSSLLRKDSSLRPTLITWGFAILGGIFIISTGGMSSIHYDRYLTWIYPLLIILQVSGVGMVYMHCKKAALPLLLVLAIFNANSTLFFARIFRSLSEEMASTLQRIHNINSTLTPGTHLLNAGTCPLKYFCPDIYVMNLSGIDYAPLRGGRNGADVLELWREHEAPLPEKAIVTQQNNLTARLPILSNPKEIPGIYLDDTWVLYDIDTNLFSQATLYPVTPEAQFKLRDKKAVAQLNIGHRPSEEKFKYKIYSGLPGQEKFTPQITTHRSGDIIFCDAAVPVAGIATFESPVTPNRPALFVCRLIKSGVFPLNRAEDALPMELSTEGESLWVQCNDGEPFTIRQTFETGTFAEIILPIPQNLITEPILYIKLTGLHIPASYWIYQ
jgi:hypothetical protein